MAIGSIQTPNKGKKGSPKNQKDNRRSETFGTDKKSSSNDGTQINMKNRKSLKRKSYEFEISSTDTEEKKKAKTVTKSKLAENDTKPSTTNDKPIAQKDKKHNKRKNKSESHLDGNKDTEVTAVKKMKVDPSGVSANKKTKQLPDYIELETKSNKVSTEVKKSKKNEKSKAKFNDIDEVNLRGINYLTTWRDDRKNWKFDKNVQKRLITVMFDETKLPDEYFQTFLEYMAGGSESIKKIVTGHANNIISEMEKWNNLSEKAKETAKKVEESQYDRARNLVQYLQ
uniref:WKF domain-containing protein n=1 Tax=Cuerna arida TaxID=1464854 RepID=A0A1B6FH16_9HEMI